jgi:tRNA pseudouridine55 synthase
MSLDGLFLVDKPEGPSSFGVLRSLRPALGRKVGHAGTLDPFASGLLLVLAGAATRLAHYLVGLDKAYRAEVQFGAVSTTLDPEGEITPAGGVVDEAAVREAAAGLTGRILQRVPAASAVRVDGERAYVRMRRGEAVEPPPREVTVETLAVEAFDAAAQRATIFVRCSKGTYVRQIAADMGERVGSGAYCSALRRLQTGGFSVEAAGRPEQILEHPDGPWRLAPAAAIGHLPGRALDPAEVEDVRHGRPLTLAGEQGPTRLLDGDELAAVAEPREGRLRPVLVLSR